MHAVKYNYTFKELQSSHGVNAVQKLTCITGVETASMIPIRPTLLTVYLVQHVSAERCPQPSSDLR